MSLDTASKDELPEDDVDEQPDFSFLFLKDRNRTDAVIVPRHGAKHFEPDGSAEQEQLLERSRSVLNEVLLEERQHVTHQYCRATWHPFPQDQAEVIIPRGNHLLTIGHTVGGTTWLLPEETLYLMERGVLLLEHGGVLISIQQAYALCIGANGMSFEKYQTYSYLKRLGYSVLPAPLPPARVLISDSSEVSRHRMIVRSVHAWWGCRLPAWLGTVLNSLWAWLPGIFRGLRRIRPLVSPGSVISYEEAFNKLRIIPSGWSSAMRSAIEPMAAMCSPEDGYTVDYHVYKPSGKFRKKEPGNPAFRVVVASAQTQSPPSLETLEAMFALATEKDIMDVVFAVVDGGSVSFLKFEGVTFKDMSIRTRGSGSKKKASS